MPLCVNQLRFLLRLLICELLVATQVPASGFDTNPATFLVKLARWRDVLSLLYFMMAVKYCAEDGWEFVKNLPARFGKEGTYHCSRALCVISLLFRVLHRCICRFLR